jgi:predicted Zn-dependent protease
MGMADVMGLVTSEVEVTAKPTRRRYTAEYKHRILREADAVGVGYAMSAGYDPYGAVRIHEKLLQASGGSLLPFLSSHPSGEERIENLKAIIRAKNSQ